MRRALAITFDGILQPLGYSQVARVLMGLSERGFEYTLLSLERNAHLQEREHVARVEIALRRAGVRWIRSMYTEGSGAAGILANLRRATALALRIVRSDPFDLIHARALHAGLVARAVRAATGVPYLLDARGYWVDEQVLEGRRFQTPLSYRVAKAAERALFAGAAAVVTLTELQADDVRRGAPGPTRPVRCIPTCADYDDFRPIAGRIRPPVLAGLPPDARLLGVVGSLNQSYHVDETLKLARLVLAAQPAFHLVVLSNQITEYTRAIAAARIPSERVLIAAARHDEMPDIVPHLEWGLLLLREHAAKRASMPTKLAEFFASGVRVAQFGCNPEVSSWVRRASGGIVLASLSDEDLAAAAAAMTGDVVDVSREMREATAAHFSLRAGIDRYAAILESLGERHAILR